MRQVLNRCPKDMRINSHVKYGSNNEFILVTEEGEKG